MRPLLQQPLPLPREAVESSKDKAKLVLWYMLGMPDPEGHKFKAILENLRKALGMWIGGRELA